VADRRAFRSLLIGVDGSPGARRAVSFATRLAPPPGGRATVVRVMEPARPPSMGLLPASIRADLAGQMAAVEAARLRGARREVESAAARLEKAGWRARGRVISGLPLVELLQQAKATNADLLVLGARGVGGVERFLLGSVADAATKRSSISVLIVK
jgi:nucleotide-binding universal stress UspA family protein